MRKNKSFLGILMLGLVLLGTAHQIKSFSFGFGGPRGGVSIGFGPGYYGGWGPGYWGPRYWGRPYYGYYPYRRYRYRDRCHRCRGGYYHHRPARRVRRIIRR